MIRTNSTRVIPVSAVCLTLLAAGCAGGHSPSEGAPAGGGTGGTPVRADARPAGNGGTGTGSGDSAGTGGAGPAPDANLDPGDDAAAEAGSSSDGSAALVDSSTPMNVDGLPPPSYEGQIPLYDGSPVGPVVQMDCPGDPTEGWTPFQDSFYVQRPYNKPINTRFSIVNGVYNFWVFPNDFPHAPDAGGRNPRTEARYGGTADKATGGNFSSGMRMYSADMLIEKNAVSSAIMQIHATDPAVPIGVRIMPNGNMVNNGTLTVVQGSSVPGGLIDRWFNYKASLDTTTMQVKIYVNNCLKATYTGQRGSGAFYFKNGVYFCKTSQNGCFSHYKNVRFYRK
jgi:hypothetical protein